MVDHIIGVQEFRLFSKPQNPAEELVADFHLCGNAEVGIVHLGILDILFAKAVNHSIQKRIDETNIYKPLFAAVHGENPLGVCFQVDLLEHFLAVPRLPCEADVLHAVNTIGSHFLSVIVESQKVVVAVVDEQLEGADRISGSVAAFHLFAHIADRILQVFEGDFLWCVRLAVDVSAHGFIDGSDII